jgi:hypothetical protein
MKTLYTVFESIFDDEIDLTKDVEDRAWVKKSFMHRAKPTKLDDAVFYEYALYQVMLEIAELIEDCEDPELRRLVIYSACYGQYARCTNYNSGSYTEWWERLYKKCKLEITPHMEDVIKDDDYWFAGPSYPMHWVNQFWPKEYIDRSLRGYSEVMRKPQYKTYRAAIITALRRVGIISKLEEQGYKLK